MEVPQAAITVADVAQDHAAAVRSLGTVGTRPCALDTRMRKRPAKATHLVLVSAAGPCGAGLSRELSKQAAVCWVGAPALMPQKAGDRGPTARRDARPLARRMHSGDRPPVEGPAGADAARRALRRARADTRRALQAATLRRKACWLRHDSRSTGRAPWSPAHRRWLSAVVGPPRLPKASFRRLARPALHSVPVWGVWNSRATRRAKPDASRRWARPSRPCAGARARWRCPQWPPWATGRASSPPDRSCLLWG